MSLTSVPTGFLPRLQLGHILNFHQAATVDEDVDTVVESLRTGSEYIGHAISDLVGQSLPPCLCLSAGQKPDMHHCFKYT